MVWLTLADDGIVNVHQGARPVVLHGRHGNYQEDFFDTVPYATLLRLVSVNLAYWCPVAWEPDQERRAG